MKQTKTYKVGDLVYIEVWPEYEEMFGYKKVPCIIRKIWEDGIHYSVEIDDGGDTVCTVDEFIED